MPETTPRSPAQPAVVFGLTILIVGLSFALPHTLVPPAERTAVSTYLSPETANVYACGDVRGPLLSLFFVSEALVWGTFSRYGGPVFLTGVYVFHIAAGSYFHYFGSYFVAHARTGSKDALLSPQVILAVNVAIIALGYLVARNESLRWLIPILGIQWFTLWVAVHLVSSDLFPLIKGWRLGTAPRGMG